MNVGLDVLLAHHKLRILKTVGKKSRGVWALHVWTERVPSKKEGAINYKVKCLHCQFPHSCDWKTARPILICQWWGREEERRAGMGRGQADAYPARTNILITVLDGPMGTICPSDLHEPFTACECGMLPFGPLPAFPPKAASVSMIFFFKPEWLHFFSKPDFYRCQ